MGDPADLADARPAPAAAATNMGHVTPHHATSTTQRAPCARREGKGGGGAARGTAAAARAGAPRRRPVRMETGDDRWG